jgi:hypothetical protein
MTSTKTQIRKPAYAYHEIRPGGGVPLTEWAIERQLSLAHDYDESDLVAVLLAMNPDLDESIAADIEKLLDLGDQVAEAERRGGAVLCGDDWIAPRALVVDEYAEHLRKLARLVRSAR